MRYSFVIAGAAALLLVSPILPTASAPHSPDREQALKLFNDVLDRVHRDYVDDVSDKKLVEDALHGMLSALDPHSSYLDPKEFREMQVETKGQFGGLGMQVTMENSLVKVISPIDDTPAARAGIKPGDLILKLDDQPVPGMTLSEAVDKMRGPIGTSIKLTVRREGQEPFDLSLTRAEIKVQSVKAHLEGDDVAYVRITSFSEQTYDGLEKALTSIKLQSHNKLAGMVLDLRNDPGGLLDQAVKVAGAFLEQGQIVSIRGRGGQESQHFDAAPGDLLPGLPIVVLINGGSASASEIVAGALQDDHRAVIMGTKSFGKGSVQTIMPLFEGGGALRLTTALYYTPSGRSIQAKGIEPDILVEAAKIEPLKQGDHLTEAMLRGALKNTQDKNAQDKNGGEAKPPETKVVPEPGAAGTKSPPPNAPPGAKPATPTEPGAGSVEPSVLGTAEDYQLERAVDLIRGVSIFENHHHMGG
jgi:carboxyl-terminal processing protease